MAAIQPVNPFAGLQQGLQQAAGFFNKIGTDVGGFLRGESAVPGYRRERRAPKIVVPPRAGTAPFAAIIPGDSVGEAVITTGLLNFLNLYNTALIVRLVLTWFPNPPAFIEQPLATVTDPYLGLFRGIIPPIGGTLDLSPILAFVVLNFFTSTAAALPCEVGPDGQPKLERAPQPSNPFQMLHPTRIQEAWNRRVAAQRAAKEESA